jgi:hypothetical protein
MSRHRQRSFLRDLLVKRLAVRGFDIRCKPYLRSAVIYHSSQQRKEEWPLMRLLSYYEADDVFGQCAMNHWAAGPISSGSNICAQGIQGRCYKYLTMTNSGADHNWFI